MKDKNKSSCISIEIEPEKVNAIQLVEKRYFILKRGIFNRAYWKKILKVDIPDVDDIKIDKGDIENNSPP